MGVAGDTAPGSGMEHNVGHLLEMAERPGAPAPLHGAKVGALAVLAAMLWARVRTVARGGGLRALRFPSAEEMEPRVRGAFATLDPTGLMGQECWRAYSRKLERWHEARPALATLWERWPAFDEQLDGLLASPERLVAALRAARAPVRLTQLGVRDTHRALGARPRAPDARALHGRGSRVFHGHLGRSGCGWVVGRRRAAGRGSVMAVRRVSLVDQVRQGLLDDLLGGQARAGRQAAQRGQAGRALRGQPRHRARGRARASWRPAT